jgi:hypothetical protein
MDALRDRGSDALARWSSTRRIAPLTPASSELDITPARCRLALAVEPGCERFDLLLGPSHV